MSTFEHHFKVKIYNYSKTCTILQSCIHNQAGFRAENFQAQLMHIICLGDLHSGKCCLYTKHRTSDARKIKGTAL